jgi:ribosomal protein L16 Arg81 hydroxylase
MSQPAATFLYKGLASNDFKNRILWQKPKIFPRSIFSDGSNRPVSWNDINSLLNSEALDFPKIKFANSTNFYMRGYSGFVKHKFSTSGDRKSVLLKAAINFAMKDKCTMILNGIENDIPSVEDIANNISRILNCKCAANLYAANLEARGFGCHFDDHDVIAAQMHGEKRWDIYDPTRRFPSRGEKSFYYQAPSGPPDYTFTLQEGDALYVPSGFWHDVHSVTPPSVHISFSLDFMRGSDIVESIFRNLKDCEEFRRPASGISVAEKLVLRLKIIEFLKTHEFSLPEEPINTDFQKFNTPKDFFS